MKDTYNINSHKLAFHPVNVSQWILARDNINLQKKIYPIYVEISVNSLCTHRCVFCAFDFLEYPNISMNITVLKNALKDMKENGVKSVLFSGEGEPLLYKDLKEAIDFCREINLDVAVATNFAYANLKIIESIIKSCEWIKISINGGNPKVYSKVHGVDLSVFNSVITNIENAVAFRNKYESNTTIGTQIVLLDENVDSIVELACVIKKAGADYLVVKKYSQHEQSINHIDVMFNEHLKLKEKLQEISDDKFDIIYRADTVDENKCKSEITCHAVPFFWAILATNGDVYGCSSHFGNENFIYGNINKNSFSEIWESDKRISSISHVKSNLEKDQCRLNCRMSFINKYLNDLLSGVQHVNFI